MSEGYNALTFTADDRRRAKELLAAGARLPNRLANKMMMHIVGIEGVLRYRKYRIDGTKTMEPKTP